MCDGEPLQRHQDVPDVYIARTFPTEHPTKHPTEQPCNFLWTVSILYFISRRSLIPANIKRSPALSWYPLFPSSPRMSTARCSSCHCYSRGCPEGLPNHKHSAPGPNCTNNAQGRHYRDPNDVSNPVCDHESRGARCEFFATNQEYSSVPYPPDVSLGSVSSENGNNIDVSQIIQLLQQQKADSDRQIAQIQEQVTALSRTAPPCTTSSCAQPTSSLASAPTPTLATSYTPSMTGPIMSVPAYYPSAPAPPSNPAYNNPVLPGNPAHHPHVQPGNPGHHPHVQPGHTAVPPRDLSNAAAALNSQLSTGLGFDHNLGYQRLTMDQLRSDPRVLGDADRLLQNGTQNVHPLNPLNGMGTALGAGNNVSTVDQLYAATMRNKQLKAFEFAATGQFSYRTHLKQDNTNAVTFAYGSFKHLEAAKLGLIKMPDDEFLARLRHLKNVFEVACLSSNLTSFTEYSWQVAREYDTRVISDIESGAKSWATLSNGLETDAIYCASQTVDLKTKAKQPKREPKDPNAPKDPKKTRGTGDQKRPCTTYNTHKSSEGCYWEHLNKGETCIFEHFCSWCKSNREVKEKHKLFECEHKPE